MRTMYDKLVCMPLFSGMSGEEAALFLEKTCLHFFNLQDKEYLMKYGDECRSMKCAVSGNLVMSRRIGDDILLTARLGAGCIPGLSALFGLDTSYRYDVRASGKVSVMEFSKEEFHNTIRTNHVFQINCLNYIGRRGQRCDEVLAHYGDGSLRGRLARLLILATDSECSDICLHSSGRPLLEYLAGEGELIQQMADELCAKKLITLPDAYNLHILSRKALLEYPQDKTAL